MSTYTCTCTVVIFRAWTTQAQRQGFAGVTIGPKPVEKNVREFSDEQMRAGQSIIGLQV